LINYVIYGIHHVCWDLENLCPSLGLSGAWHLLLLYSLKRELWLLGCYQ